MIKKEESSQIITMEEYHAMFGFPAELEGKMGPLSYHITRQGRQNEVKFIVAKEAYTEVIQSIMNAVPDSPGMEKTPEYNNAIKKKFFFEKLLNDSFHSDYFRFPRLVVAFDGNSSILPTVQSIAEKIGCDIDVDGKNGFVSGYDIKIVSSKEKLEEVLSINENRGSSVGKSDIVDACVMDLGFGNGTSSVSGLATRMYSLLKRKFNEDVPFLGVTSLKRVLLAGHAMGMPSIFISDLENLDSCYTINSGSSQYHSFVKKRLESLSKVLDKTLKYKTPIAKNDKNVVQYRVGK